jgi:peptidoglycan biosynthesis protein MviN/MurJ (putative lipid II flippase)
MHNTRTPFYIALASEAVNILAVIILIGKYQVLSLAIAFSLSSLVQMFLLLFSLRSKFSNLDDKRIINSVGKVAIATFSGGIFIQLFKYLIAQIVNLDTFLGVFTQLSISTIVGAAVFIAACHFLKLEEFMNFKESFIRRILKSKRISLAEDTTDVTGM